MAEVIEIGDISVTRVAEWEGEFSTAHELLPDSRREVWDSNSSMLVPDHWNPDNDALIATLQSYLVRSGGKNILIDTGAGDDKDRPYLPMFHMLKSGFLDRLAAAGVTPEQIDLVVLTHIHVDHVGWNTSLVDGEWIPTFPNADYVFPRVDFDYWDTSRTHERRGAAVNLNMFDDSIGPIARHGRVSFWEGSHIVDGNITLEAAPGHTPGHALIKVESRGDRAAFVGDLLHSPGQILQPDWSSVFSEDPVQGAATRRKVLGWAADENILIMPAHFGGDHAVEIDRRGDGFAVKGWRAFKGV